jgi:hypothetical protein
MAHTEMTGQIGLETVVARSDRVVHSEVDGDVMMMNAETGTYYSLTAVGARVWALLENPMSGSQICDRLMTEYRVDRSRCEDEILNLVRRLAEEGALALEPQRKDK